VTDNPTGDDIVNGRLLASLLAGCMIAGSAASQERTQQERAQQDRTQSTQTRNEPEGRGPPPQAYEDCKGKKAGDTVQHTTPEGKVTAACEESPKGLVARPTQRKSQGAPSQDSSGRSSPR
jgi:hypothetical protein